MNHLTLTSMKKLKLKTFQVECSETVIYVLEVKAHNRKQAEQMVYDGEVDLPEASDSNGFQVDNVELITK